MIASYSFKNGFGIVNRTTVFIWITAISTVFGRAGQILLHFYGDELKIKEIMSLLKTNIAGITPFIRENINTNLIISLSVVMAVCLLFAFVNDLGLNGLVKDRLLSNKFAVGQLFYYGKHYFLRCFGFKIILFLIVGLIIFGSYFLLTITFQINQFLGLLSVIFLLGFAIPLILILMTFFSLGVRSIVIDEGGIGQAFRKSFQLFRKEAKEVFVFFLIVLAVFLAATAAVFLAGILLGRYFFPMITVQVAILSYAEMGMKTSSFIFYLKLTGKPAYN